MDNDGAVKKDQDAATGEGSTEVKNDDQQASSGDGIDYAAEYAALMEENSRIASDRDNYREGLLALKNKKGRKATDDVVSDDTDTTGGADVDAIADRVAAKLLPQLQMTVEADTIGSVLGQLSGDANEQKLIMYHFQNSVAPTGTIRERLENAKLIANKKAILKTNNELKVAIRNRSQIGNTGQGSNTEESTKQGSTYFTAEQLAHLKKRGLDPEKVKANILRKK